MLSAGWQPAWYSLEHVTYAQIRFIIGLSFIAEQNVFQGFVRHSVHHSMFVLLLKVHLFFGFFYDHHAADDNVTQRAKIKRKTQKIYLLARMQTGWKLCCPPVAAAESLLQLATILYILLVWDIMNGKKTNTNIYTNTNGSTTAFMWLNCCVRPSLDL